MRREFWPVTVQVLGLITVDAGTVVLVRKNRRPKGTTPLINDHS